MKFLQSLWLNKHFLILAIVFCLGVGEVSAQLRGGSINPYGTNSQDTTVTDSLDVEQKKYVKRNFDHKEQVITSSVIMLTLVVLLAGMNNYNPKR